MKSGVNRTRWYLLTGLAVLLLGVGLLGFYWLNHPMSQPLALTTPTQDILQPKPTQSPTTEVAQPTAKHTETPTPIQVTAIPTATPTITPTDIPKICGNTGKMYLLVIGLTLPTDEEKMGADAIRLVTLDFDKPSITILPLPAWLWVDTPVLAYMGLEENQITAVYLETFERVTSNSPRFRHQGATQAVAQTILDNFGFAPDHYITVDEHALINYVDLIGGIQVDLPRAVDGSAEEYGIYPAGEQTLDGERTLNFARLFHPGGMEEQDLWGNMERQKLVVMAILDATLKPQNLTKIPTLIYQMMRSVFTDLSVIQAIDLACIVEEVGPNIRILGVTEEMVYQDEADQMIPDLEAIRGLITQLQDGD